MTSDELAASIHAIIDAANGESAAMVSHHIGRGEWLWSIFERVVLLTGGDAPSFADIELVDNNGPSGWIVVITQRAIVRAEFSNPRTAPGGDWTLDVQCEKVPRTAISSVRAEVVKSGGYAGALWPEHAQITITLDRELTGRKVLTLPASGVARGSRASKVAHLASEL